MRAISAPGVKSDGKGNTIVVIPAPHNHLAASPDGGVTISGSGCVGSAGGHPAILRVVFSPRVQGTVKSITTSRPITTPDDHFAASPYCRVPISLGRRIGHASGCPTISAGIVFSAVVEDGCEGGIIIESAPHDHFGSCPDGRVIPSSVRYVGSTRGRPTVGARIVSPAGDRIRREY